MHLQYSDFYIFFQKHTLKFQKGTTKSFACKEERATGSCDAVYFVICLAYFKNVEDSENSSQVNER
jgi:hypothetical protein